VSSPRLDLALVVVAALSCVLAAVGVWLPASPGATEHVHLVDLSRSCSADPSRLIRALSRRLEPGAGVDPVAVVGFAEEPLLLAPLRPADDLSSALETSLARVRTLPGDRLGASDVEAGAALADSLPGVAGGTRIIHLWSDLRFPAEVLEGIRGDLAPGTQLRLRGPLLEPEPSLRLGVKGPIPALAPGEPAVVRVVVHIGGTGARTIQVSSGARSYDVRVRPEWPGEVSVTVEPAAEAEWVRVTATDPRGELPETTLRLATGASGRTLVWVYGDADLNLPRERFQLTSDLQRAAAVVVTNQEADRSLREFWRRELAPALTERGQGVVVLGGPRAFRAGGYAGVPTLEELLPLSSRAPEGRDVCVALDRSGSMDRDERLIRAVEAVERLARGLGPGDRLQVWPFGASAMEPIPASLVAPGEFLELAMDPMRRLVPTGGTRLMGALNEAAAVASAARDRQPVLAVLSDLRDDRMTSEMVEDVRTRVAAFKGAATVLLLDPTDRTTSLAAELGLRVVPVRELTPELFLANVDGESWLAEAVDTRWITPVEGAPEAGSLRARNLVLRGSGARVFLETTQGAPLLADARRGAGRIMAFAGDPGLESWTRALVPLMIEAVAFRGRPVSASVDHRGLTVGLPAGFLGPFSVGWSEGGRPRTAALSERSPGIWWSPGTRPTGAVRVFDETGTPVFSGQAAVLDDPEYLSGPLATPLIEDRPVPTGATVRWPLGLIALLAMGLLVLRRAP